MVHWLLCENSASATVLRTILQGIIAATLCFLAFIQAVERVPYLVEVVTMFAIPAVMAILSPLMVKLGKMNKARKDAETSRKETDCMGTGGVFGEVR